MSKFGERVAARRVEIGITQDELAKRLGYKSRSTIAKIESGVNEVSVPDVPRFAKALLTTEEHLMGLDEMKKNSKAAVGFTKRLSSDEDFRAIVKRLDQDEAYFELSKMLLNLNSEQIEDAKIILRTTFKQFINVID